MRLIDADKLRHELIMGGDLVGAKYTDMADTVEAVPIEWIRKWYTQHSPLVGSYVAYMLLDWEEEK